MGLMGPVLAVDGGRAAWDDYWYTARTSAAGLPVTSQEAMTIPAFYAAVSYVSEDVAKLPLSMYEDLGAEQGRRAAPDHELEERLHYEPNKYQTSLEWREMVTAIAILRGRCINERLSDGQIIPLHPDLLRRDLTRTGARRWWYRDPLLGGQERAIMEDEAFIVRGRHDRSVLDFASTNMRVTLDAEALSSFLFRRGAKHQGVIKAKGRLPDPVKAALRTALDEYAIDGPRAGRPLLLEDGMEWQQISMTPQDAQLIESKQLSVADACRWIRISPHKVFDLSSQTNASIEKQLAVDYVVDSLLGWVLRWEQAIYRDLITDKTFFAKHTLEMLLRGDPESRARMYSLGIMWGWLTRNEVRGKEDMNPIEGLDDPLTPTNMTIGTDGSQQMDIRQGSQALLAANASALAEATEDPASRGLLLLLASDAASRIVRREMAAMTKLADRTAGDRPAWVAGVTAYYVDHAEQIARDLHIPEHEARRHVAEQVAMLHAHGLAAMDDWLTDRSAYLAEAAIAGVGPVDIHRPRSISLTVLPAPVHIADGAIRIEAATTPNVHVTAPVQVDVAPAQVHVAAPQINVEAQRPVAMRKRVVRGAAGQISEVIEEPVNA